LTSPDGSLLDLKTRAAEFGTPAAELGTRVAEFRTPVAELGTPAAELGTPAAELGTPAAELGTPVAEFGTPATECGIPDAEFGTPVPRELTAEYGRGFSYAEIARMNQFSKLFPEESIVVTLSQQLSWSHFHALLPIKNPHVRDFYAEMCRIELWDVRTPWRKIGGMLFECTALLK